MAEYSKIENVVKTIEQGKVDDVYADLIDHEKDSIKIAERVSDDIRHRTIKASSLWNTSLANMMAEYVDFMKTSYDLIMADKGDEAARRLLSPDGFICAGITLLILTLLMTLLRI